MALTIESGKAGLVKIGANTLDAITHWTLRREAVVTSFGHSGSSGHQASVAGRDKASGTIAFKTDTANTANTAAQTALAQGAGVTLLLYVNATKFWTVPAVISSVEETVDIDTGTVIGGSASFESNGAFTYT